MKVPSKKTSRHLNFQTEAKDAIWVVLYTSGKARLTSINEDSSKRSCTIARKERIIEIGGNCELNGVF